MSTKTITRVECPPEVTADLPAEILEPADAVLKFNAAGGQYLVDRFGREDMLAARLKDARAACPAQP